MQDPALDNCLELISNPRRREIIHLLRAERRQEMSVDILLDRLSTADRGTPGAPTDTEPLAVELSHIHLPKLAANGVIEYEPKVGRIRYRSDSQIEAVLDSLPADLTSIPC
jgi:DNA-binding transcriptional ArsR family regulator